jgi:hypothetical protein
MRDGGSAHVANRHVLGSDYYNTTRKKRLRLIKSGWLRRSCNSARIAAAIGRTLARVAPSRRGGIRSPPQVPREIRMAQALLNDIVCSTTAEQRAAQRAAARAQTRVRVIDAEFSPGKKICMTGRSGARAVAEALVGDRIRIGDSLARRGARDHP